MASVQTQVLFGNSQSVHFEATRLLCSSANYATEVSFREKAIPSMNEIRRSELDHSHAFCSSVSLNVVEMRRVFQKFDENNDGLICVPDLLRFMKRLGFEMSDEEALSMLGSVDCNGDGRVDFDEFLSLYRSLCDEESTSLEMENHVEDEDETLLEAFRVFDKNADGFITKEELQTVLLDLGMPEGKSLKNCQRMIQNVDVDGNGEIDIGEFKEMMMSSKYIFCEA